MTVKAYRTQPFQTTHENRVFDLLLEKLNQAWAQGDEIVILLGNLYCYGEEIDAVVIKQRSISVIEFKDYGGDITFSESGPWSAGGAQVRGGSRANPFVQVRSNRYALASFLKGLGALPSGREQNFDHVSGLVVFHQPIVFEDKLPVKLRPWFFIVDVDHVIERLDQITSRGIDLTEDDVEAIVKAFNIQGYIPAGQQVEVPSTANEEEGDLAGSIRAARSKIADFLNTSAAILVMAGMEGTGRELVLEEAYKEAVKKGRSCLVLAPNRRLADSYNVKSGSIYSHIYSRKSRLQDRLVVYSIAKNNDLDNQVYVVGDAHLISDSYYESDLSVYGSGRLLADFLGFADIEGTKRQIIIIGDPYQLNRGKPEESALAVDRLRSLTDRDVESAPMTSLLPGNEEDIRIKNCVALARGIQEKEFNRLEIKFDRDRVQEISSVNGKRRDVIREKFVASPEGLKYLAYSNKDVNRVNWWLRKTVFGRSEELTPGDVVQIYNGFSTSNELNDPFERVFVPSYSFAVILEVKQEKPLIQHLTGREKPMVVEFLKIKALLMGSGDEVCFLCLKDYLYAEIPELDKETLLALYVNAERRFKEKQETGDRTGLEDDVNNQKAEFFSTDIYLNAARMRFGYALTLHRGQSQCFDTIIADMDIAQGKENENYFRWLYTLFTIPRNQLFLINVVKITPLSKAEWKGSQAILKTSLGQKRIIGYDPSTNEAGQPSLPFSIGQKELRNLYRHIDRTLAVQGIKITSYKQHNYQEVYGFQGSQGAECGINFFYNNKFQVSKMVVTKSQPEDFGERVHRLLAEKPYFETELQEMLYQILESELKQLGFSVTGVEHSKNLEVYYIQHETDEVKLHAHYDDKGFITTLMPQGFTSQASLDELRKALGV